MGFLTFLFYFFLIIFAFRILFRLFFPLLLRFLVKKYGANGGAFTWSNIPNQPKHEEGKVTINSTPSNKTKIVDKGEGDYVDYVEIK